MLIVHYDPVNGWSAPEIKPYGPLSIDPASSCLQYSSNIFEGMKVRPLVVPAKTKRQTLILFKSSLVAHLLPRISDPLLRQAYLGADGKVRLFRPQKNMERLARSASKLALPVRAFTVTNSTSWDHVGFASSRNSIKAHY